MTSVNFCDNGLVLLTISHNVASSWPASLFYLAALGVLFLGVVIGVALAEVLGDSYSGPTLEVIGFSEEEGVRFGAPFIGSRALVGALDEDLLSQPPSRESDGLSLR